MMKSYRLYFLLLVLFLSVLAFTACIGVGVGGTTAPGTTGPGTTGPGTTDPGTTDPGTTAPGTTAPGTTAPGTTAPGTTAPGTTAPGTTAPGTTAPGTTAPGTTAPGTTAPGTTAPGTTAPGTTAPGTTAPGTTAPGTPDPGTPNPGTPNHMNTVLAMAYQEGLLGYTAASVEDNTIPVYASSSAVIQMLHAIRATKNADSTIQLYINRCVEHLKNLVNTRYAAPLFDLTATWAYVPLTGAILVAKQTPAVWNKLSALEQEKLDFVMEVFAYVFTLGTDDNNSYTTGPGMMGNYNKTWNPNYRLANVIPMLFIGEYFGGAAKLNQMLHAFSYDDVVAKFQQYGFNRAYENWTRPNPTNPSTGATLPGTKTFMENGGPAYTKKRTDAAGNRLNITEGGAAGTGVGVRTDYTYDGCTVDEVAEIVTRIFGYTYSGGPVVSSKDNNSDGKADAYILDGTKSPYEGLKGMMLEFNSGARSSAAYCSHDFMMVVTILFVLEELDLYDISEDIALQHKVWVGNQDFLYKYQHGYLSTSGYNTTSTDRESSAGDYYHVWRLTWLSGLGGVKLEDLPVPDDSFVFDPTLVDEDFSETTLDLDGTPRKVGLITFSNKAGNAMKTVAGNGGNTYLHLALKAGGGDPTINIVDEEGGLAKLIGEYSAIIFSIDLAKLPDVDIPVSVIRLRGTGTSDTVNILDLGGSGSVSMLGKPLTTLTKDFQTISVKVDFETGTLTGYVNGTEVATATMTVPSISKAKTPAEWLDTLTVYILNWWIQAPGSVDRALLIDNINVSIDISK